MGRKKQEVKQVAISKEVRDFAQDAFDYIWSQQKFFGKGVKEKFAEAYTLRNFASDVNKTTHFNENIGKTIRITQFLLRDYFGHFFKFSMVKKDIFKKEVKLFWSNWINNRSDIFVKVIESIAIIAEAFLFCDCYLDLDLELNEMHEWFIEWFNENLASEFFKCGGWKSLHKLPLDWYLDMFNYLKKKVDMCYSPYHSDSLKDIYTCPVVTDLRFSPVKFPVPEGVICHKCQCVDDETLHTRTVYVRLLGESPEREVKCEDIDKYQESSSKLVFEDALNTENSSTLVSMREISDDTSNVENESQVSFISNKTTTEKEDTAIRDFCTAAQKTGKADLIEDYHGIMNTSKLATSEKCSEKEILSSEHTIKCEQTAKFLSDTHDEDSFVGENPLEKDKEIARQSETPIDESFSDNERLVSPTKPSTDSEEMPNFEESSPTKSKPKTIQPSTEISNKQGPYDWLTVSFRKSDSYNKCMNILQQAVLKDCKIEGSSKQYNFHLISEKYLNSYKRLFEAHLDNHAEEEKLSSEDPEVSKALPESLKYEEKSSASDDLFNLEIMSCEYRYYFLGGEKLLQSPKEPKKKQVK